jgi:hypothetical protein
MLIISLDKKKPRCLLYNNLNGNFSESLQGRVRRMGIWISQKASYHSDGMIFIADWGKFPHAIFDENTANIHNIELKAPRLKPIY